MKISVCMIVRNEVDQVGRALSSIPDQYERIVVDTGSTDGTFDEALRHGASIFSFEWTNDFSEARNFSIEQATGNYVLVLDADEVLCEGTEEAVRRFVDEHPSSAGSVIIRNQSNGDWTQHRMVRFFPNEPSYRFAGQVHEQIVVNGVPADFEATSIAIEHYGYNQDIYEKTGKYDRYLNLYSQVLKQDPKDGYMWYQLGKLHYSNKKYELALSAYEQALMHEQFANLYFPPLLVQYGYTLKELGRSGQALSFLSVFEEQYTDYPDLPFLMALLAMDTGDITRIAHYFERSLSIGETTKYSTVIGVGTYKAAYNLGVFYEITGQRALAVRYYTMAREQGYAPAKQRLSNISI
ncbi:tetratricopeptide repeat-containing glycosyltransferase family 2 protein [Paenibacillus kobensis]|uniref:tetratricopeptide repeat-containing glycosyltransferase family 2 protein n=1 Tax=Paenibacillus kobensis TaxID=59841 RepID=UPI000FDB76C7|nr:glycosyltransferase family 2 protein [Paenibacillus kobensis]